MLWVLKGLVQMGERASKLWGLAEASQSPPEPIVGEEESRQHPLPHPLSEVSGPFSFLFPARPCPQQRDPRIPCTPPTHLHFTSFFFLALQKKSRMAFIPWCSDNTCWHLKKWKHTLFYCVFLYCTSQYCMFYKFECLWQVCIVRWQLAFFFFNK